MALPPLVEPAALTEFKGSPFPATPTHAAGEQIRRVCGWHIAPEVTETVVLDSDGGPVLALPTLRLSSVAEVRDLTRETPVVVNNWRMSSNGTLVRLGGWPWGAGAVEVTFTHGYESCPMELLPLIAGRVRRRVAQESLGSRSVTYLDDYAPDAVLARFKLPALP